MAEETITTPADDKPAEGGGEKPSTEAILYNKSDDKATTNEPAPEGGDDKKPTGEPSKEGDDKATTNANQSEGSKAVEVKDLKVPKDSTISDAQVEQIATLSTKHKLTTEAAQELLNIQADSENKVLSRIDAEHENRVKEWVSGVKSDTELGGAKFNETSEYAQRAVKKFGSDELVEVLNKTGYGNHPELVRVFARIGRAMADDKLIKGTPTGETKNIEDIFYNKT